MGVANFLIGRRYNLEGMVGKGGMGSVYRAYDRLAGETIALKRVHVDPHLLNFNTRIMGETIDVRLALAREFRTIAALRHPNIISVLDYGFDEESQPYFTMPFMEDAKPLHSKRLSSTSHQRIDYLIQILQALDYLHRHNVIHRDLKPSNILVTPHEQIKIIDFGLAMPPSINQDISGTLLYMAPELLKQQPASIASDLYAVGVMAYELIAGQPAFDPSADISSLLEAILYSTVDFSPIEHAGLMAVVARLMAKLPFDRFHNAQETLMALCAAVDIAPPAESVALRESVLQSARFTGRQAELGILQKALDEAEQGRGQAILIGGESGIGKSRLIEELRILAMVEGYTVLAGQGVEGGGLPYQVWRSVMRSMVLLTTLKPLEESVLKEVVPDIETLLEHPIPDAPFLQSQSNQQRLMGVISDIFQRQRHPILLILEDLQWTQESLDPLRQIMLVLEQMPLFIVGSYRDDERPTLPQELPTMPLLKLHRLTQADIESILISLVGFERRDWSEFLYRETEGNAFFLIEAVRTLAEEAGQLGQIQHLNLPQQILAGGIAEIVQHRLERLPAIAHPLLKLAAVMGRQIDEDLLDQFVTHASREDWYVICANASILEIHNNEWRFSHDKIRQAVLKMIAPDEMVEYHRAIAEVIERIYPDNDDHALGLAYHWQQAQDFTKERHYTWIAARQAFEAIAYRHAKLLLERYLILLEPDEHAEHLAAWLMLAEIEYHLADYVIAQRYIAEILDYTAEYPDPAVSANACYLLSQIAVHQGEFDKVLQYLNLSIKLAETSRDRSILARVYYGLGDATWRLNDMESARPYLEASLTLSREIGDKTQEMYALNRLGAVAMFEAKFDEAEAYYQACLQLAQQVGNRERMAVALSNLGENARTQGNDAEARINLLQTLPIFRQMGHHSFTVLALVNLALIDINLDNLETAQQWCNDGLALAVKIQSPLAILSILTAFVGVKIQLGEAQQALQLLGLTLEHPAADSTIKTFVRPFQEQLQAKFTPEFYAAQYEIGRHLVLEEIVAGLLAQRR